MRIALACEIGAGEANQVLIERARCRVDEYLLVAGLVPVRLLGGPLSSNRSTRATQPVVAGSSQFGHFFHSMAAKCMRC
jgi:hypothetical protein